MTTKICISGGVNTGKTTAARAFEEHYKVKHTDALMELGWSKASEEISAWLSEPGSWVVEGVRVPYGLRKWLEAHPTGSPCDYVINMQTIPHVDHTPEQASLSKGAATVLEGIRADLLQRGTRIIDVVSWDFLEGLTEALVKGAGQ